MKSLKIGFLHLIFHKPAKYKETTYIFVKGIFLWNLQKFSATKIDYTVLYVQELFVLSPP